MNVKRNTIQYKSRRQVLLSKIKNSPELERTLIECLNVFKDEVNKK